MNIPDNNPYIVISQLDHLEEFGESVEVVITYRERKVLQWEVRNQRDRIIFGYAFGLGWLTSIGYEIEDLDVHLEKLPLF